MNPQKALTATVLAPVALLLVFALLMAGGSAATTAAETPLLMLRLAELNDTPTELGPLVDATAARYGADPDWLAAAIRTQPGWLQLPVRSRRQMLADNRQANAQARQNPCHPEYSGPQPDPPPDCSNYQRPPDQPTDRPTLTAAWRAEVETWLPTYLAGLFGVATPEQIPRPADLGARLPQVWPAAQEKKAREAWQALRAYRQIMAGRDQDREGFRALTDREDYHWRLEALDWEYSFPVAGGGTFSNDWHNERPQNKGKAPTRHQGCDVFAPQGTPLVAVARGQIVRKGWDDLGGWTLVLEEPETGLRFYYAHLAGYAPGIEQGQTVERGTVLGYVGTSGEGPEGTSHVISQPHLHFGIYMPDAGGELVTNPYPYLAQWRTP